MKNKLNIFLLAITVMGLAACSNGANKFLGKWEQVDNNGEILIIEEKGKVFNVYNEKTPERVLSMDYDKDHDYLTINMGAQIVDISYADSTQRLTMGPRGGGGWRDRPLVFERVKEREAMNESSAEDRVKAKDVTLSGDKDFRWYEWDKAPKELLEATKNIQTESGSLFDHVKNFYAGCQIKVAAMDLNGNGVYGVVISAEGSACCGSSGCTYDFYEDGGSLICDLGTDMEVKPGKNGVIASSGRFFGFYPGKGVDAKTKAEITKAFSY